ncbi:MAG: hypothetical protein IT193_04580 [Propionibacteriaceae bacterium]|nr:hypothetical protein [Propionibacteriaceae bacterium]
MIVCSPGRNYVRLKIATADGIVGWGDATLNGRELALAYLSEHDLPAERHGLLSKPRYLAIPMPSRLLASRHGNHESDRRRQRRLWDTMGKPAGP